MSLAGRRIVVTRAEAQAHDLVSAIEVSGGSVVRLPLLEIVDAVDGGAALEARLRTLEAGDWLVVLSPNGARRIVDRLEPGQCRLAVIGSGTATVFENAGWSVDLLPEQPSSEGLLDAFGAIEPAARVIIAQAADGRTVLADGLRAAGRSVEVVEAYRNILPEPDGATLDDARTADVVVFASPSAVSRYVDLVGCHPALAACIGGVTGSAAREAGFDVAVASEPTVRGLLEALAAQHRG